MVHGAIRVFGVFGIDVGRCLGEGHVAGVIQVARALQ